VPSSSAAPLVGVVAPWRSAPRPLEALAAVAGRRHPFLRHFAGGPADLGAWSFLAADPRRTFVVAPGAAGPATFPALARLWPRRVRRIGPRIPFAGGWAGVLGYELRSACERLPPPRRPPLGFPDAFLARYDACVAWDHAAGKAYLAGLGRDAAAARAAAARLAERVARGAPPPRAPRRRAAGVRPRPAVAASGYRRLVAEVRARILRGDLFQANLSQRFDGRLLGTPLDLFRRLAAASPVPFLTYADLGGGRLVLSASPERFLSLRGDRVETRPMKGTSPRGRTPAEDRRLAAALARSEKDRAELAMIVDLSRNDLSRACRAGSVRVATARRLERYATVHQAVGVVVGRLRPDASRADLLRACFPPGSVTGAPKVEAMRVIDDLEGEGRGPYCGAIGWLDEGGDLDLAVAIRTLCVEGARVSYRVGGGVTLLSDPAAEHEETLDKGRSLAAALSGTAP
jgi:para-aminobenzoate synthetase component 1